MKVDLIKSKWIENDVSNNKNSTRHVIWIDNDKKSRILINKERYKATLQYSMEIQIRDKEKKFLEINFLAEALKGSGGSLKINGHVIPINAKANMPITPPLTLSITLDIAAESELKIQEIELKTYRNEKSLISQNDTDSDVLVIAPNYPNSDNLYLCGFAHSRVREYINEGLKVQVCSISEVNWYQTSYVIDEVPVFQGTYYDLKKIISTRQYKTIVVHFVDEKLMQIFDGYVINEKLIFICHGPETTFEILPNKARPYFTKEIDNTVVKSQFAVKKVYVEKYAAKLNVTWVFVSKWLQDFSEKQLGFSFKQKLVINNVINEELFPYSAKNAEDRKNILIIRKFDNISYHSIDQSVLAIRELSKKPYFKDLTFNIYGDGNFYDELLNPIKEFNNVHLHRSFIANDKISSIHRENGILLIPSRHDAHAVAMGEGTSSGMVVVGSNVTSNGYFMNNQENHTLADPEDPLELANIIERLYKNPEEFLAISKRMSAETRERCCKKNTVQKEITLIKEQNESYRSDWRVNINERLSNPILTIVIPAYNVEAYIEKCLFSLLNHRNIGKTELILVNDGSTDDTLFYAEKWREKSHGILKIIDKENGGHGSTINVGIKEARGKYFRLIDGDDWVDSENLAKQIDLLESCTTDLMLTKGSYEYVENIRLENIIDYDFLKEGSIYNFEDLTYPYYGFQEYGPLLTTATYRTQCLKDAEFYISENKPYVDMEFNTFSLEKINTLCYFNLDIYRYLIGREGQTVAKDFWKKKYKDHCYIIFNIAEFLKEKNKLSKRKRIYVRERILTRMIDSQVFMYDQICKWDELELFTDKLSQYPNVYRSALKYITEKNAESHNILKLYKEKIKYYSKHLKEEKKPIINQEDSLYEKANKISLKSTVKTFLPHGMVMGLYHLKQRYANQR